MSAELVPGPYILNGFGDLGIYTELRKYFGKQVELVKKCKSGLYYIRTEEGEFYSVPKGNLETLEQYNARIEYLRNRTPEDLQREFEAMSKWTVKVAVDIKTQHGLDLENELTKQLLAEIAASE